MDTNQTPLPVEETPAPAIKPIITYEEFSKMDIRVGTIVAAEPVPETDKLLKCTIDFGEIGTRTIVSGIKAFRTPEQLIGKQVPYIVNLAPRTIKGIESQGMLLALSAGDGGFSLLHPDSQVEPGSKIS
jgi:methionyl-tRNA synthetase